ncbi:MAG: hypothetical protein AAFN09_14395 [Pseudomonadota bacterium]
MSEAAKGYAWHSNASMPFHAIGFTCELARDQEAFTKHWVGFITGDITVRGGLPKSMWIASDAPDEDQKLRKLPDSFVAGDFFIVSQKIAFVFQSFNLGSSALLPVDMLKKHRQERFDGNFYMFHVTEKKSAFLPDHSENYDKPRYDDDEYLGSVRLGRTKDDEIAVAASALDGPDVWKDPTLLGSLFFSDPLYAALSKADVLGNAQTIRCRAV